MTPSRAAANRQNAKRSTGPKSAGGKARVARNARKHGLAASVFLDAQLVAEVERLALQIAGPDAQSHRLGLARQIAEAEVDLSRIRRARHERWVNRHKPAPKIRTFLRIALAPLKKPILELRPSDLDPVKALFVDFTEEEIAICAQMAVLHRYERRALSRRRAAIRAFDAYCDQMMRSAITS